MQVTLIRHGKTAGNSELRYIGRTDEPLAPEGIAQVEAAGVDPALSTVYVSPLQRTRQTAALLFPNARQIVVDDLREMDFGDFEGRSYNEMADDAAYRAWVDSDCLTPCPNGESREEFARRVCAAFEGIVRETAMRGETALTFVVHGGTVMAVLERFARPPRDYYDYSVKNCRGYICDAEFDEQGEPVLTNLRLWERNV